MKKNTTQRLTAYLALTIGFVTQLLAQTGTTGYEFLNIPVSAHSAALGGNNLSIIEDDVTLLYTNPALLTNVSDRTLNFNYMSYMSSSNKLSATYVWHHGDRGTWGVGAQVLNYGKMTETNANFEQTGSFSANDIAIQGGYTYQLSDRWTGGAQGKLLMSHYGDYSATAIAADLALNYFDEDRGFSLGIVAQNLGGEVNPLYEQHRKLPFNLAVGFSKDFANAPIRISCTLSDLTHWSKDYYAIAGHDISGTRRLSNHLSFGADIFPSSQTWVAIGYNCRRAYEMKVQDKSHWAGLSLGGGIAIKKFKISVAYAKYHIASSSFIANASYVF